MSESYIKQLEEANEKLTSSLERVSFLKDVESKRSDRKFMVIVRNIHKKHVDAIIDTPKTGISSISYKSYNNQDPPLLTLDIQYQYTVFGMKSARSVIESFLYKWNESKKTIVGTGICWSVSTVENDALFRMRGWIITDYDFPAYGGNRINHYKNLRAALQESCDVTERYFSTYGDYVKAVSERKK